MGNYTIFYKFDNPRRSRQARHFTGKCSENSRSQVVFRTDIFRKLTLGALDYGAEKPQKWTQNSRTSGEANLLEASQLSPILACFARPTKTCHATAGYGKDLFYGRRYDLPKVRHRSTGLRCIDDNAKQKMFQLCEELTAYDTCTESRFFVVVFDHRRIDAWKRNDHSTKDWLCQFWPVILS